MKNKIDLDLDQIIKLIKASKTNPSQCNDCQNNTCKIHKSNGKPSGADKSSRGSKSVNIKMNRGIKISGRAGKPVLDAGMGVSLGNPNVVRQSVDTVLQQDTAKLSNELTKYQLELAKKQQADYDQYKLHYDQYQASLNGGQRFKSNKFINDDDEYDRFNDYFLSKGTSLGLINQTNRRIDNIEKNYFKRKGNPNFDATDGPDDNRVEIIDGGSENNVYDYNSQLPKPINLWTSPGSASSTASTIPLPSASSTATTIPLPSVSTELLPENNVIENNENDVVLNSPFAEPDKFPRYYSMLAGGGPVSGFVGDNPEQNSLFAGDNSLFAGDNSSFAGDNSSFAGDNPMFANLSQEPDPGFGIPAKSVKTKQRRQKLRKDLSILEESDSNMPENQSETQTQNEDPEIKQYKTLKIKSQKSDERQTDMHKDYMLYKVRRFNKAVPKQERFPNPHMAKIKPLEKMVLAIEKRERQLGIIY